MEVSPIRCGALPNRSAPFWGWGPVRGRRGSKSAPAFLGEGAGRQPGSDVEFRRYLSMAMGSADEARLWCDYAADLEYVLRETSLAWQDELSQIARMLHGLRDSLSEN